MKKLSPVWPSNFQYAHTDTHAVNDQNEGKTQYVKYVSWLNRGKDMGQDYRLHFEEGWISLRQQVAQIIHKDDL